MIRCTKKLKDGYAIKSEDQVSMVDVANKLGHLEDALEIMEKLKNGTPVEYVDQAGKVWEEYWTDEDCLYNPFEDAIEIYLYEYQCSYKMSDYGVGWWLKEDKSE